MPEKAYIRNVDFHALGPLTVRRDGVSVNLGGPKQRIVLAVLLIHANRVVSVSDLIDSVWGEDPPTAARHTLVSYISELRKVLDGRPERTGPGYLLQIDTEEFDVLRFEALASEGRSRIKTDPSKAAEGLSSALSLWEGRPYDDLIGQPAVDVEARRLEEMRLAVLEERIEADLGVGRHVELIGELEALAREHPFRERLTGQLMRALYRSGRQVDALRVYSRTREKLVEELGIEPSPGLRELEQRILEQDPDLEASSTVEGDVRAFLFTDLEASTALWETHPTAMAEAVARQDRILTETIESANGSVFKNTGDGVLAVFGSVDAAVVAAKVADSNLRSEDWGLLEGMRVRMAIDLGEAHQRRGDWFGPPLNRCARLLSAAHGGQILISEDAVAGLNTPASVADLGQHRFKGLGQPLRVFQLATEAPGRFPPIRLEARAADMARVGFDCTSVRGYELHERIGEGDFGVVYRAYQSSVGRQVAIKVIRPEYANRASFIRQFEAEAQVIAQLGHPHIVSLYDYWRDPEGAYLVMPFMRGGSLADGLSRGPWNVGPALHLLEQICAALSFAHRQGVIHRDVKPGNVLLDEDGNGYLSDFGISAHLSDAAGLPVTTSLAYVPPEELRGEPLSSRSDIFALGALTFELLTGIRPHGPGRLPPLSDARPGLPPEVDAVLRIATADQPDSRFERVEDFLRSVRTATGTDVVGVATERKPVTSAAPIRNPYKGLRAFQENDAADFFGRAALVDELLEAVSHHRLVAVVGSSGSGKSSAVRAGLLPAIRAGGIPGSRSWLTTSMYPGSYPFEELEAALLRVAVERPSSLIEDLRNDERGLLRVVKQVLPSDDSELLLVIDQFEEVFSMVEGEETRLAFLSSLAAVAGDERGRVRIVLTLRADFFHRPLDYPGFGDFLRAGLVPVTPPSEEGLALAISRPVRAVGLDLEPGLVGEIIRDVQGEPGSLPLMQYALTELFHRREGDVLTVSGYRASGGVLGALGRRAEELFEGLSSAGQEAAHQLFLRLVTVDEETDDTRRRVRQGELRSLEVEQNVLDDVIQQFASYRLLSFDQDPVTRSPTVEVAHEALLREWPRLRGWIEEQRDGLLLHRRLVASLVEWKESEANTSFLLSGGRLQQYETWSKDSALSLTAEERDYLVASRIDEDHRERRRTVRRWSIVAMLAAATFVIGLLALRANDQARLATVRELSAASIARVEADPDLAILLALQAAETSRSAGEAAFPETVDALHRAVQGSRIVGRIPGGDLFVEYSPNGELIVVASGTDAAVWSAVSGQIVRTLPSPGGQASGAAFSHDGSMVGVAYTGGEGSLALWDVATGDRLALLPGPSLLFPAKVSFSPDNLLVAAAGGAEDPAFVWRVVDGTAVYEIGSAAFDVAFSPDGSLLAVVESVAGFMGGNRNVVSLYDPFTGVTIIERSSNLEATDTAFLDIDEFSPGGLAFDPSGSRLAVVSQPDQGARIVDLATREVVASISSPGSPVGLAWSPDGSRLALAGNGGNPRLYDGTSGGEVLVLPGPSSWWVTFSPDGSRLAAANSVDGDTLIWDITPGGNSEVATFHLPGLSSVQALYGTGVDEILVSTAGGVGLPSNWGSPGTIDLIDATGRTIKQKPVVLVPWPLAFSPTAGLLGVANGLCAAEILDTGTLAVMGTHELPSGMYAKAISADGNRVLADLLGPLCEPEYPQPIVVEYPSRKVLATLPPGALWGANFSPDGGLMVVNSFDSGNYLYDIETEEIMFTFDPGDVLVFAFSPDGKQLAATTPSGTLSVFDVATLLGGGPQARALLWSIRAHVPQVPFLEYTPDGTTIVTGGVFEGRIRVWDAYTGERITEFLTGRTEQQGFFNVHPDGRRMVALGGDDTLRVYTLDTDELIQIAKDRVTRAFTEEECRAYLHLETCPAG